ncbi:hypothetical protein [Haloferax sulfurifontis]|uniref:N-acetyltransferase domain-containing protein n=2 Tax=Haloferax sulfurifontis TaxID=255616 RepID=M0IIP6_9EURY|nr:hypothetical protein [Haloferax sulfurifontis]ELZ96625.1 hypothetical protein C441_04634 [Haloferax sulfurifontis ATCC BAA-897]GGC72372.1 hypothetical protein GCM10007209_37860 [Haloferax sulfurifontis]
MTNARDGPSTAPAGEWYNSYQTRAMQDHDAGAVRGIWMTGFGHWTDRDEKWLTEALAPRYGARGRVAVHNGRVLGYTVYEFATGAAADTYAHDYYGGADDDVVGIIDMVATRHGCESAGIAGSLVDDALHDFEEADADAVVAVSWRRESTYDSAPLFESRGFEAVATLDGIYREFRSPCPECGTGKCECQATMFVRGGDADE